MDNFRCPVCRYEDASLPPYSDGDGHWYQEICPRCGVQFGYKDATRSHSELRTTWLLGALKQIAMSFIEGRASALETAIALAPFEDEVPTELRGYLTEMVGVASETDAIPLGARRELWHPDVRAREDEKHDRAQVWAEPVVRAACEGLLAAL
jgi:hypothetical protein